MGNKIIREITFERNKYKIYNKKHDDRLHYFYRFIVFIVYYSIFCKSELLLFF